MSGVISGIDLRCTFHLQRDVLEFQENSRVLEVRIRLLHIFTMSDEKEEEEGDFMCLDFPDDKSLQV